MVIVYCSTPHVPGVRPLSKFVFVAGAIGTVTVGLRPGLCQRLTNSNGNLFAVRAGPVAQARNESLLEFTFQEALLNDGLESGRKFLDAHESLAFGQRKMV